MPIEKMVVKTQSLSLSENCNSQHDEQGSSKVLRKQCVLVFLVRGKIKVSLNYYKILSKQLIYIHIYNVVMLKSGDTEF